MKNLLFGLFLIMALSCCSIKQETEIPYPTLHGQITYFQEKEQLYSHYSINREDIVLVGDDLFDRGMWRDFYGTDVIKNRGIALEGTECTLYRISSIANAKPSKIFISTGLYDIKKGRSITETTNRINEIISVIRRVSPKTEYYLLGQVADEACRAANNSLNDSIATMNSVLKFMYGERYIDIPSVMCNEDGYMFPYYGVGPNRINGAGYQIIATTLEPYIGFKAMNSIFNDPIMVSKKSSPWIEAAEYYHSYYQEQYAGRSAHYIARLSIFNSIPNTSSLVVMLGDSINNNCWWDELLGISHTKIINRGISGDMPSGILARIEDVINEEPSKIFIMTGVNDFIEDPNVSVESVWETYKTIIGTLHQRVPQAELFIHSTLPLNPISPYYEGRNTKVESLDSILISNKEVLNYTYIDLASLLKDSEGNLDIQYTADGIHLLPSVYLKWKEILLDILAK